MLLAGMALSPVFGSTTQRISAPAQNSVIEQASAERAAIIRQVSPAVVNINVVKTAKAHGNVPNVFNDPFFRRFFAPRMRIPPQQYKERGLASGFIVNSNGYILTNNHVVENTTTITVKLKDGREFNAKLVGTDPATDVAVVKINAHDLPTVKFGNSDKLQVGDAVLAFGNPFGLEQTVTEGIVSAKGRSRVGITNYEDFIQTDASINPGNSGGPLVSMDGKVVGIDTAIFSRSGGSMGIGFAIPSNMAAHIMHELIKNGKVVRGFLGVYIQDLSQNLAQAMNVKVDQGVLVSQVGQDTPASKAGLKQGDIILSVNGRSVHTANDLRNLVAAIEPGKTVPMSVLRAGRNVELHVTIAEQPKDMQAALQGPGSSRQNGNEAPAGTAPEERLGMQVQPLTAGVAQQLGYDGLQGVLVSAVQPGSPASDAGLQRGALIMQVGHKAIHSVGQFRAALERAPKGKNLLLLVRMGQGTRYLAIKKH